MKKILIIGILISFLIIGNISANSVSLKNDSEEPIIECCNNPDPCYPVTNILIEDENEPVNGWQNVPVSVLFYAEAPPECKLKATYATLYNPDEVLKVELLKKYWYWESGIYKINYWSVSFDEYNEYEETHKSATLKIDNTTPYISNINIQRELFTITIQADIMDNHSGVFSAKLYLDNKIMFSDFLESPKNNVLFNWTLSRTQVSWGKNTLKIEAMYILDHTQSKEITFNIPKRKTVLFNFPLLERLFSQLICSKPIYLQ